MEVLIALYGSVIAGLVLWGVLEFRAYVRKFDALQSDIYHTIYREQIEWQRRNTRQ